MLFKCVSYQVEKDVILEKLRGHRLCGILHNMDEGKKVHMHFIVEWEKISPIKLHYKLTELLGELTLCKTVFKFNNDYDYFTHKHNRQKYHYNVDDIFTNDADFFIDLYTRGDYTIDNDLITDLQNPDISIRTLAEIYGLDFVKNVRTYVYFRDICTGERTREAESERLQRIVKEQAERVRRNISDEKSRIVFKAPFLLSVDDVSLIDDGGLYTENDYDWTFEWYRRFIRSETNVVKEDCFNMLPPTIQLKVQALIKRRTERGVLITVEKGNRIPLEYSDIFKNGDK